jgi:hypothetical protein
MSVKHKIAVLLKNRTQQIKKVGQLILKVAQLLIKEHKKGNVCCLLL